MVRLVDCRLGEPLLECVQPSKSSAHPNDLELVRLVEDAFDCLEFRNDRFKQVPSVSILDQVELIDDKELYIKVRLFFNQLIQKTVCFLDSTDSQVHVWCPYTLALRVKRDNLEVDVFCQPTQVSRFLRYYTDVWQHIDCSLAKAKD